MKSIITKAAVAIGIGLVTGSSAAYAEPAQTSTDTSTQQTTMGKVEHGTTHVAKTTWRGTRHIARSTVRESKRIARSTARESEHIAGATARDTKTVAAKTWDGTKDVARTVVHSPVIAWQVMRGERPLFTTARAGQQPARQQMALTGHRANNAQSQTGTSAKHYEPPI
jgi:hypothetical protein